MSTNTPNTARYPLNAEWIANASEALDFAQCVVHGHTYEWADDSITPVIHAWRRWAIRPDEVRLIAEVPNIETAALAFFWRITADRDALTPAVVVEHFEQIVGFNPFLPPSSR